MEGSNYETANPSSHCYSKPQGSPVALTDVSVCAVYKQLWTDCNNLLNTHSAGGRVSDCPYKVFYESIKKEKQQKKKEWKPHCHPAHELFKERIDGQEGS